MDIPYIWQGHVKRNPCMAIKMIVCLFPYLSVYFV